MTKTRTTYFSATAPVTYVLLGIPNSNSRGHSHDYNLIFPTSRDLPRTIHDKMIAVGSRALEDLNGTARDYVVTVRYHSPSGRTKFDIDAARDFPRPRNKVKT